MNLVKMYVEEVFKVKDKTKEYEKYVRDHGDKNFKAKEPVYEVVCKINCCGNKKIDKYLWNRTEFEKIKKDGYFLG